MMIRSSVLRDGNLGAERRSRDFAFGWRVPYGKNALTAACRVGQTGVKADHGKIAFVLYFFFLQ